MSWIEVVILGIVQGLTEFLPVSSSAHLRILPELLGWEDPGASFTAVTQIGTEAAVLIYFRHDIGRILTAWFLSLYRRPELRSTLDARMGWYVGLGTIPIGILGLLFSDQIKSQARNLWINATVLVLFAFVLLAADLAGRKQRVVADLTLRDGLIMGGAQALALIPGVSRSGGTISAGLFLGLTREAAARFSFLLAIPAVVLAGVVNIPDVVDPSGSGSTPSLVQTVVATAVAFVLGYVSIAWLLQYVARHSVLVFVVYRIALGGLVLILLSAGAISAT